MVKVYICPLPPCTSGVNSLHQDDSSVLLGQPILREDCVWNGQVISSHTPLHCPSLTVYLTLVLSSERDPKQVSGKILHAVSILEECLGPTLIQKHPWGLASGFRLNKRHSSPDLYKIIPSLSIFQRWGNKLVSVFCWWVVLYCFYFTLLNHHLYREAPCDYVCHHIEAKLF